LKSRQKSKPKGVVTDTKFGLGWYNREHWSRLREISEDREQLEETFEEWEASALISIEEIERTGQHLEKVYIDPEGLLSWCNENGLTLNGKSRARYVSWLLRQREIKT